MSRWYNFIAKVYDNFSTRTYQKPRKALIDKLGMQSGDSVFLVGCGTGLLFHLIQDRIGERGMLVGLDASKNMLSQADKKVQQNEWKNVHLIHADARDISSQLIKDYIGKDVAFDHVIGELSFSVMPEWQSIMRLSLDLLKDRGKFGVLDGYRPKKDWLNLILNVLPQSDISRPISSYLNELTQNYSEETFGLTKIVFIGVGDKIISDVTQAS